MAQKFLFPLKLFRWGQMLTGANAYQIIDEEQSYDPVLEPWDFKPGDIVSCSYRKFESDRGHKYLTADKLLNKEQ